MALMVSLARTTPPSKLCRIASRGNSGWVRKVGDHADAICGARLSSGVEKWIFAMAGIAEEKATAECAQDKVLGPDNKPVNVSR